MFRTEKTTTKGQSEVEWESMLIQAQDLCVGYGRALNEEHG